MGSLIAQKTIKARKEYSDDSADFLNMDDWWRSSGKLKFSELRSIAKLKANNWKILPGQMYVRQYCEQDGLTYTFKSLPEILAICLKHHLFDL
jgi:hypothetical protein